VPSSLGGTFCYIEIAKKNKITDMKKYHDYQQKQNLLIPPRLDSLIDSNDLCRVVNRVIDELDPDTYESRFRGGGRPSYHPKMMLKILVYGYCMKIYSSRKIALALRRDIAFMWLSGRQNPEHNTINRFRGDYLKEALEQVFASVVQFLLNHGYIKSNDYFVDGTKFEADAGKYTHVWKKSAEKFSSKVKDRAKEIMEEADLINEQEDLEFSGKDLASTGSHSELTPEEMRAAATEISKQISDEMTGRQKQRKKTLSKKLEQEADKLQKYNEQLEICKERNSYSKTDHDATFMRMKNDEVRAGYNVQAGSQSQYITTFSVSQNSNDATAFKAHMQKRNELKLPPVDTITADSIYGTEDNYEFMESLDAQCYLKYPTFHRETHGKKPMFSLEDFEYDEVNDQYKCPGGRELLFFYETSKQKQGGNRWFYRVYGCETCEGCSLASQCKKTKRNKRLHVNHKLAKYRKDTKTRLLSDKGFELRRRRGFEIETPFADIKHNLGYRRIRLRGIKKATAELALVFIGYNLRKAAKATLKAG
jgi:transposase